MNTDIDILALENFVIYKTLQENINTFGVQNSTKIFKMEAVKFSTISPDIIIIGSI